MSHLNLEPNEEWKTHMKCKIHENLHALLFDAKIAFEEALDQIPLSAASRRRQLTADFDQSVRTMQVLAAEQYQIELERERQERKWNTQATMTEEWSWEVQQEQQAIYDAIKQTELPVHDIAGAAETRWSEETEDKHVGSSWKQDRLAGHATSSDMELWRQTTLSPEEEERKRRAEAHEAQQEQFRLREQEIRRRVTQRKLHDQLNWEESIGYAATAWSGQREDHRSTPAPISPEPSLSKEQICRLYSLHSQQWARILTYSVIRWTDFPWPILSDRRPTSPQDLTFQSVCEYILSPLYPNHNHSMSKKERIKDLIRYWHPDRFEVKYVRRVREGRERDNVREGAGIVVRFLNDLLGRMNGI